MHNRFKEEKHYLHLQYTFSEVDLKLYQLATFYSLQQPEEHRTEAYLCTVMNTPCNSRKQP